MFTIIFSLNHPLASSYMPTSLFFNMTFYHETYNFRNIANNQIIIQVKKEGPLLILIQECANIYICVCGVSKREKEIHKIINE